MSIRRAFRRTDCGHTETVLVTHERGTLALWQCHMVQDRTGRTTGAETRVYTTAEWSPEEVDEYGEWMIEQIIDVEGTGEAWAEITLAELGDLDTHARLSARRQTVLDDDQAEAAVERLSGSGAYYRD